MKQFGTVITGMGFVLGLASGYAQGQASANLGGTVRDAHGTPLMGALVELLGPDASVLGHVFTDDHGRYLLQAIGPGTYQLQATAAFLLPVHRTNLHLRAGAHAIADVTMTAVSDAATWLPAERRQPGEASDDWQWTLRSTANRPLLRLSDQEPTSLGVGSAEQGDLGQSRASAHLRLTAGAGRFGEGGVHEALTLERTSLAGTTSMVSADMGSAQDHFAPASTSIAAGFERRTSAGAGTRLLASVASQPVLVGSEPTSLAVLRSAAAQTIAVGDAVIVDAGTLFTAEKLFGDRYSSAPYVRVAVRAAANWTVEYRFASDRHLQSADDLDQATAPDALIADAGGRPLLQQDVHQEVAVTKGDAQRTLRIGVFRDSSPVAVLQGAGLTSNQSLGTAPALGDAVTGTFHLAAAGYSGQGATLSWSEAVTPAVRFLVQGAVGKAIKAEVPTLQAEALAQQTAVHNAVALRAAVDFESRRLGSSMLIRYRWQQGATLTDVDPFDTTVGDAYLGFSVRQHLVDGRHLGGIDAVVQATNLLAQGYEPLLGSDGKTLYLAQMARSLTAGLNFSF